MASRQQRGFQLGSHSGTGAHSIPSRGCALGERDSYGFTLVELLIVLVILPLVVGAIAVALLATFRVQTGISDRLSSSGDTQIVSANFARDIQSAVSLTTSQNSLPQCGNASPILGLEWPQMVNSQPTGFTTVVSYSVIPSGTTYQLVRNLCAAVGENPATPSTPTITNVLSQNVLPTLIAQITCDPAVKTCPSASTSWTSVVGVQSVTLSINESTSSNAQENPGNYYVYALNASPRSWDFSNGALNNVSPLELVGQTSLLSGCNSGATVNINGPMLINSASGGVSGKTQTINTAAVYFSTTTPSPTPFVGPPPFTPLTEPFVDPLSGMTPPNPLTLNSNPSPGQPGVWTTMITGTVALAPGIYYFTGSGAGIHIDNATLSGSGVLLYFTNNASLYIGPNSTIDLHPMSRGAYAGVTIWQDNSDNQTLNWSGNASSSGLNGVVYSPGAAVSVNGTDNFFASNVIANQFSCSGGGNGSINIGYTYQPNTVQTLTFTSKPPSTKQKQLQVGDTYSVSAQSTNFGNPIIYSIDSSSSSTCTISGQTVSFLSPGTCIVDANQYGTFPYWAAIEIQQPITVKP